MLLKSSKIFIVVNLAMLAWVLRTNYMANAIPIAGRTSAEVSDMFPTLFTPAGFTFAIWGVIYLLLLGFAGYIASFWNKPVPPLFQKIDGWFFVAGIGNAAWLPAFHNLQIGFSMLFMLFILGALIMLYLRLGIGVTEVPPVQRWLVHLPISVYLGWISVATIANVSILLTHLGWNGQPGGPQFWTVVVIVTAVAIGLMALLKRNDNAFALVIVWAPFGIYSKRINDLVAPDNMVEIAASAGMLILSSAIAFRLIKRQIAQNHQ